MGSWRGQLRSKYIVHLYKALRKLGKYFIKSKKKNIKILLSSGHLVVLLVNLQLSAQGQAS